MTANEFELFYVKYESKWRDMLKWATRGDDIIDDILQDTCLYFLDGRLDTLDTTKNPESCFRMKLIWIMRDTAFERAGRDHDVLRFNTFSLSDLLTEHTVLTTEVDEPDPLTEASLHAALESLPAKWHDAVIQYVILGRTATDLAAEMGIPVSTFRWTYLNKVLPSLRKALKKGGIKPTRQRHGGPG